MRRFPFLFALSLLVPMASPAAPARAGLPDRCAAAAEFSVPDRKLEHLAAAVRGVGAIEVLAVGSGTTVGQDGGGGNAFPYLMIKALRAELPGREIHLTLRGARGATAAEMLKLIETELAEQDFALVLWQTGTVEAVRGTAPEELQKVLQDGIARVRADNADLVLIDAQYSRAMAAKVDELPYLEVMREAAKSPGVVLFRRFDLLQSWAAEGRNDLAHVRKADREKAIDALHVCVADVLARFVSNGAGIAVP